MIIDSPVLTNLPTGTDRMIPETGDSQVIIPSVIQPVIESIGPLNRFAITNLSTIVHASSLWNVNITRTNQAAVSTLIALLSRGLWDLAICLATRFNYTTVLGVADVAVTFDNEANTQQQFFAGRYAAVGSFVDLIHRRVLFSDNTRLEIRNEAQGVGETVNVDLSVLANRLL